MIEWLKHKAFYTPLAFILALWDHAQDFEERDEEVNGTTPTDS